MGTVSYSGLSVEVDPTVSAQITALDLINGTQLNTAISGFLTDAPSDGSQYARQNGSWSVVTGGGGGGISDAPSDGSEYVRKNGAWSVATGGGGGTSIPVYDNGVTYSVNDQVIYNNRFWYMSTYVGAAGYDPIAYPSYWTEISPYTDTGLTDAPSDNVQYVRYNGSWVSNTGFTISDAPSDGNFYVRWNSAWQQIGSGTDNIATENYVSQNAYPLSSNPAGYLTSKTILQVSGGTYQLSAGDENKIIFMNGGMNGNQVTVPADWVYSFPNGTEITILCDLGSGTNQISGQYAGQPVFNGSSAWSVTITNPVSKLVKVATDTWYYY